MRYNNEAYKFISLWSAKVVVVSRTVADVPTVVLMRHLVVSCTSVGVQFSFPSLAVAGITVCIARLYYTQVLVGGM